MLQIDWRINAARSMRNVHVRTLLDLAPDLDVDRMLRGLLFGASGKVVAFDQSYYSMARVFGGTARRQGAPFIALPHGEEALTNFLTKPRDRVLPPKSDQNSDLYDLVIHASDFTIKKAWAQGWIERGCSRKRALLPRLAASNQPLDSIKQRASVR